MLRSSGSVPKPGDYDASKASVHERIHWRVDFRTHLPVLLDGEEMCRAARVPVAARSRAPLSRSSFERYGGSTGYTAEIGRVSDFARI